MNRLEELRKKENLSMREVAKKLNMPYTTYVNYEKGTREPNSETLIMLAKFFDVSVDYLIGNAVMVAQKNKEIKKPTDINVDELSELNRIFSTLSPEQQAAAKDYLRFLAGKGHEDTK